MVTPRRALLSVSDKTDLVPFATRLAKLGFELVSTGGTARALRDAGLTVREAGEATGSPEILRGRAQTLHPTSHGATPAPPDLAPDLADPARLDIGLIDLVVVNLYPCEATVAQGRPFAECIEQIDIGGPAMIRAAAKNHAHVGVVVDPADYDRVAAELEAGQGLS